MQRDVYDAMAEMILPLVLRGVDEALSNNYYDLDANTTQHIRSLTNALKSWNYYHTGEST